MRTSSSDNYVVVEAVLKAWLLEGRIQKMLRLLIGEFEIPVLLHFIFASVHQLALLTCFQPLLLQVSANFGDSSSQGPACFAFRHSWLAVTQST